MASSSSVAGGGGGEQQSLRIGLCQIMVGADKAANIAKARQAVSEASAGGANLVVLPECWNSPYSTASFPVYAEPVADVGADVLIEEASSPSTFMLCQEAKRNNIWLVGGSVPERVRSSSSSSSSSGSGSGSGDKLYNTCLVIDPQGRIVGKHRKVHLFDIDVPGKITFKESDSLSAGDEATVVQTPWGGLGVGICYDIRFPELAIVMRQRGANIIVYPGAFNMVTGPAHWELLQRARAVDSQVFVATCSPARDTTSGGYVAWGHSTIVNPWGEVLSKAEAGEEIVYADLDLAKVEEMRQNIPCWKQKRNDLYQVSSSPKSSKL